MEVPEAPCLSPLALFRFFAAQWAQFRARGALCEGADHPLRALYLVLEYGEASTPR